MRPDAQLAMRTALEHGPDYCPPDLFTGSVVSIVHGLTAHANTIAHARHVALEETFPRTRELTGKRYFHLVARKHLADLSVLRLPLARIGQGFAARLAGTGRDLAAVEWSWLEAHGAPDALALDLSAIAGLDPHAVAAAIVALHPAVRLVALWVPARMQWEGTATGENYVLITRPHAEVVVTGAGHAVASMLGLLDRPRSLGDLLERNPAAATKLVSAGALILSPEILL